MPTPCHVAESAGFYAGLECTAQSDHPIQFIPMTQERHWEPIADFASAYPCTACEAPTKVKWWGPAFRLDGEFKYSHQLPPGTMYWEHWHPKTCHFWDNCDGKHLHAVLPNGHHWDIDSRASNCTVPNDRIHRCWVRTGEPPHVTVGKNGPTCSAGAGSILSGDYHGFLRNGELT